MSIVRNGQPLIKRYRGDTPIAKVYHGDNIVWQARHSRLPEGYQEVEWISNGESTSKIDCNFSMNYGFHFNIKVGSGSSSYICGTTMPKNNCCYNAIYKNILEYNYGSIGLRINVVDGAFEVHQEIIGDNIHLYSGENEVIKDVADLYNETLTYMLFGSHVRSSSNVKIYYFQAMNGLNNNYTMNLVPCYRISDGVIGMYDLIGNICPITGNPFFISNNASNFTSGPDVN